MVIGIGIGVGVGVGVGAGMVEEEVINVWEMNPGSESDLGR